MKRLKLPLGLAIASSVGIGCGSVDDQKIESNTEDATEMIASYGGLNLTQVVNVDRGYIYDVLTENYEYTFVRYLLFDDMTARRHVPQSHIDDFDVELDRAEESHRWSAFRFSGEVFDFQRNDGSWTGDETWFSLVVPKPGATLDGRYRTSVRKDAASLGDRAAFNVGYRDVQFYADGRFELVGLDEEREGGSYEITGREIVFEFANGERRENSVLSSSDEHKTIFVNGRQFGLVDP